jgi:hypothetical protein
MERLWSRAVATGATGGKCGNVENGSDSRKPVAVGCHQLPQKCHGKEGVDGSSPSQGSVKPRKIATLPVEGTCTSSRMQPVIMMIAYRW